MCPNSSLHIIIFITKWNFQIPHPKWTISTFCLLISWVRSWNFKAFTRPRSPDTEYFTRPCVLAYLIAPVSWPWATGDCRLSWRKCVLILATGEWTHCLTFFPTHLVSIWLLRLLHCVFVMSLYTCLIACVFGNCSILAFCHLDSYYKLHPM